MAFNKPGVFRIRAPRRAIPRGAASRQMRPGNALVAVISASLKGSSRHHLLRMQRRRIKLIGEILIDWKVITPMC